MPLSQAKAVTCSILLALLDVLVSSLFYGNGGALLLEHFGEAIRGYDFRRSLFDLWILSILRFSFIVGCAIGVLRNRKRGPERARFVFVVVVCLSLTMFSYSLMKLLAVHEIPGSLSERHWFWALFVWNAIAAALMSVCWTLLSRKQLDESVLSGSVEQQKLLAINMRLDDADGRKPKAGQDMKSEETALERESMTLLQRLLAYCKAEWVLYSFGFLFLFLHSSGTAYRFSKIFSIISVLPTNF